jgi:hypothetical protein
MKYSYLLLMALFIYMVSADCFEPGLPCDREAFGVGCCGPHYCDFLERICKPFVRLFGTDQQDS